MIVASERGKQWLVFTNGYRIQSAYGVVGLDVTRGDPKLYAGFDKYLDEYDTPLTPMERAELAAYMIGRWEEIAAQAQEDIRGTQLSNG